MNFFKDFKLPKLPLFTSILSKVQLSSNLFSFFPPSTKTDHSSPPKESCRNKFSKIQIEHYVWKREPKSSKFTPFKRRRRKEVKEDLNLVANGRFQSSVAFERFQCLVANGRRRRNILFTSFHFPPNKFYLNLLFFH